MRIRSNLALTLLWAPLVFGSLSAETHNTLSKEEKAAGWILLFDGKSYSGWVDPSTKSGPANTSWTIEDGCIKALRRPAITEDLFSQDSFQDFELRFSWRISPGGNSGVKYRIQDTVFVTDPPKGRRFEDQLELNYTTEKLTRSQARQEYVVGFEYQVIDSVTHKDALRGGKYQAGALYDMLPPSQTSEKPAGEWNEARVVVRGNHTEHWLNGVKVVDGQLNSPEIQMALAKRWGVTSQVYAKLTGLRRASSPISIQNHGDEAWFRDLKIRRLK